jgi:uncharacterized protein
MSFRALPAGAAWRHHDARDGFEVVFFRPADDGYRIDGCTTAMENGQLWAVSYAITVDATWATRSARIGGRTAAGSGAVRLEADGAGHWLVDGATARHLDGCLDVDLESSVMTNALPVHRTGLPARDRASVPAAYVRAGDLAVERLEQDYARIDDEGSRARYDYSAPSFEFECRFVYDESGLLLDYPGIAVRAG